MMMIMKAMMMMKVLTTIITMTTDNDDDDDNKDNDVYCRTKNAEIFTTSGIYDAENKPNISFAALCCNHLTKVRESLLNSFIYL